MEMLIAVIDNVNESATNKSNAKPCFGYYVKQTDVKVDGHANPPLPGIAGGFQRKVPKNFEILRLYISALPYAC